MERVVFESTEQENRFETDSFEELAATLLQPVLEKRSELLDSINGIGMDIVREETLRDQLPDQEKAIRSTTGQIIDVKKELENLFPKESAEHAKALSDLETLCAQAEANIEGLRRRRKLLVDLGADVVQTRQVREPGRLQDLQRRFAGTGLTAQEWTNFRMAFVGKVDTVLEHAILAVDQLIHLLRVTRDEKKKLAGIDAERQKKLRTAGDARQFFGGRVRRHHVSQSWT